MSVRVTIAHLGAPGSFSAEAARLFAEREGLDAELHGHATPAAVLAALSGRQADLAVLPLANTTAGLVRPALAALAGQPVEVAGEVALPVRIALLARPGTDLAAVTRVVSHPQALRQCARSLARLLPGREEVEWSDTAAAARDLAAGVLDASCAVLASSRAGALHGLARLADGVQDEPDNRTFFAVLRRAAGSRVE